MNIIQKNKFNNLLRNKNTIRNLIMKNITLAFLKVLYKYGKNYVPKKK